MHSELAYLYSYLNSRLLPTEPEEVEIAGIISNLQNLLDYESQELIRIYVNKRGTAKEREFLNSIDTGYVSFKSRCDWLLARTLIDNDDWRIADEIRVLRNGFAHARPTEKRVRLQYRGFALLTQRSLRRLLTDVELILRKLRRQSGRTLEWMTVPPGYPSEMRWPQEYVDALTPKKKASPEGALGP
ncbi:MAG TPA: hypothetical protein VFP29_09825 [Methyloceanibacter sp.]|nr:hypothetical protein [Methyloceanibacter sp.]